MSLKLCCSALNVSVNVNVSDLFLHFNVIRSCCCCGQSSAWGFVAANNNSHGNSEHNVNTVRLYYSLVQTSDQINIYWMGPCFSFSFLSLHIFFTLGSTRRRSHNTMYKTIRYFQHYVRSTPAWLTVRSFHSLEFGSRSQGRSISKWEKLAGRVRCVALHH